ncbi:hypothetical protein B0T22DRAFT_22673 [Podospora appendiculata]|uniref:FUN14 family protein n=1 Tax=Podospora appendiculata TaxID=314037 RepID=A0AAE1CFI9_9PEZI|nr:hypothetical protein B0T22DRAFT_22673 [Podospora appendiculata]
MASLMVCRAALRRNAVPLSLSLGFVTGGGLLMARQRPLHLDTFPPLSTSTRPVSNGPPPPKERLDSDIIKQLSGGSLSGFLTGLLVSVFSRTLVLLAGVAIVLVEVASRYGINVDDHLKLKKRIQSSRILSSLSHNFVFKLSFGVTFALSAFMSF